MRVLEFSIGEKRNRVGALVGTGADEGVVDLTALHPERAEHLTRLLTEPDWKQVLENLPETAEFDLDEIIYEPLLGDTGRVFAAGLNYAKTYPVEGEPPKMPSFPPWFGKAPGTLVGHEQPVLAPAVSDTFDYEAELAAIIGPGVGQGKGRHIPVDYALEAVAGYTCLNDGSVRAWQRHSVNAGKNFQQSGSIGPWMVTADEIDDPQNLQLRSRVDGEERQNASTAGMHFSLAQIISYLSSIIELRPGDVIATGSPEGTGGSFDPPRFLKDGQTLEIELEGVGVLRNRVVAEGV